MIQLTREESERRRRSLRLHIIAAMATFALLIVINALTNARYPWWLWVLIVWMPLIALHTAWAMGFFGRRGRNGGPA